MVFELSVGRKEGKKKYNYMPVNTFGIKVGYYSCIGLECLVLAHKDNSEAIIFINKNCKFKDEAKNIFDKMSESDKAHNFSIK